MTHVPIFTAIWRKVSDLLKALDHADYDPVAEQQRRIAFLEQRVARLEANHGKECSLSRRAGHSPGRCAGDEGMARPFANTDGADAPAHITHIACPSSNGQEWEVIMQKPF